MKIAQGWSGLIYRKPAKRSFASKRTELLSSVVTRDSRSIDDVSKFLTRETMITNFTLVVTDHPARSKFPEMMSVAQELRLGYRPFTAIYVAENILEVTRGIIDETTVGLVRVRVREDDGSIRDMSINSNGHYQVDLHQKVDESYSLVESVVPQINGEPLTELPVDVLNTDDSIVPTPSLLSHCVDLNLQHYIVEGILAAAMHLTSGPISTITGFNPEVDQKTGQVIDPFTGKPTDKINFPVAPGAVWAFKSENTEVDWHTYDPKAQDLVINKLRDLKDALSAIGHSILAPEKPAPEATETQLIRRAAENAMLADFTMKISDQQQKVFQRFARWADPKQPDMTFELNVDFLPQAMGADRITAFSNLVEKRQLSLETFHEALNEGEIMPFGFDPAIEAERIAQETVDRPPVI